MKRFYPILPVLPLCAFLLLTPSARAEEGAQQTVQGFLETIRSMEFPVTDAAKFEDLAKKADSYLDLEGMAKKALGEEWTKASPDQQKQFMELLWKLIENIAYSRSKKFLGTAPIQYTEPQTAARGVEVSTSVKGEGEALETSVVYDLEQQNGQWKIYDILLDQVSIADDLKVQFDKILKESGFDGLLAKMRERLAKAQKENGL